jgi:hypothetical protein
MGRIICFKAAFGDVERNVEVSRPRGGGGSWHIYIDRFLYGNIINTNSGWRVLFNGYEFNQGDADQLMEAVGIENLDSWD